MSKYIRLIGLFSLLLLGAWVSPILAQEVTPEATPEATVEARTPTVEECPLALQSRLKVGIRGQVAETENTGSNVRSKPRGSHILATIDTGTTFDVVGGPECHDSAYGQMWWWEIALKIEDKTVQGWISEGAEGVYWIEPASPSILGYWLSEEQNLYIIEGYINVYDRLNGNSVILGTYTVSGDTITATMSSGETTWTAVYTFRVVGETLLLTQGEVTTAYRLQD